MFVVNWIYRVNKEKNFGIVSNLVADVFQVVSLTVVSVGVAVATVTDLQFSLFGACVAFAWIIPSATNKILWSNMQQRENWTALAYVIQIRLFSVTLIHIAVSTSLNTISSFLFFNSG